ncbi:glutamine amidotransferase-related protein [Pseudoteredinibacter isoporae]|uniref:GMP synthase-like glutamine amidotransferase n=1 Tax=Pseudoteredinibacter isoporae TaxID=570281 RepID=A0A7X0JU47_9GAMM|nr:GMP synthase [Pseudoteredinibacter isoporae]MBB6522312.1 GMP synthase-like glutamine amidotransferase [Pseudoteredinibacter isoporae]NHO87845.1 GMP synthase [Pseudoteredinibacter isoporae]NIB23824.1 GMP synthase [Pseudoteredinibacter isoporae]
MSDNTLTIGILKTDDVRPQLVDEFGEYPEMFARLLGEFDGDLEFKTYEVQRGDLPASVDEVDAYLITGSKTSVYEPLPWIADTEAFLRKAHAAKKKMLGVCFGHQLLAQALGGKTVKAEQGWGLGVHHYQLSDAAADYGQAGEDFSMLVSHQDQVVENIPGAEVLASSDFCPNAMVKVDDHILSFQAHPEFTKNYSESLLKLRREVFGDDNVEKALASLSDDVSFNRVTNWMIQFFRA